MTSQRARNIACSRSLQKKTPNLTHAFQLRLFDMSAIIFSSLSIFASILVDIFSRSFTRFLKLCDEAFDFNVLLHIRLRKRLAIYLLVRTK
jgi:hypothetical protein